MNKSIAKVTVNLSLDKTFDYLIPPPLRGVIKTGDQVEIPFGRGKPRKGYVVGFKDKSDFPKLKEIVNLVEAHPRIPENLLKLGDWMADYYCCAREQAVRTILPGVVRGGRVKHRKTAVPYITDERKAQDFIFERGKRNKSKVKLLKYLLSERGHAKDSVLLETGVSGATLKALEKAGLVGIENRIVDRAAHSNIEFIPSPPLEPNPEQRQALDRVNAAIDQSENRTFLLHGVTGSGKTEIYLQAIANNIKHGRDTIVLVPEISLTPQTVRRFRARFGDSVSVLHSGLGEGERFDEWMKIHHGRVKIAVGARSALFAPFKNIGLIIVDEEHETSYKQDKDPRYNARDVAVMRAKMEGAVAILGSATPAHESYHNAKIGKYQLLTLNRRVDGGRMPVIRVVDSKIEAADQGVTTPGLFSRDLIEAVYSRLEKGEQTILFLNRRGYARQMSCEHCGFVAACSECSISYTYHQRRQCLCCHLCGAVIPAPDICPECGAKDIRYSGSGTEKIEKIAEKLFKGAVVDRMDSDTMTRKSSYEDALRRFHGGKTDILIGTQMIAKGLHFPNVTLVGVINADQSLRIPDFRSMERTFQLITQVAGRAGRGAVDGEVIVQTMSPFNPAIRHAVTHDYSAMYAEEEEVRRILKYPPFSHLAAVYFRGPDDSGTAAYAAGFLEVMTPYINDGIIVTPPAPCPIEKIKNLFRHMVVFRGELDRRFKHALRQTVLGKHPAHLKVHADIDAINLM